MDAERAERIIQESLASLGWTQQDLACHPKGHPDKAGRARKLRQETPMTRLWMARRLPMGSASDVSHLTSRR